MHNLVSKYSFLILFLGISAHSIWANEIPKLAQSSQWKNLLYFSKGKSKVMGDKYFLSPDGRTNPEAELRATLKAFQDPNFKIEGKYKPQCLFPARFILLKEKWDNIGDLNSCEDYLRWKNTHGVGDFHIVFSNAYANNPASMFGHTFLRQNRTGFSQKTNEILGYSFAFMARPDPTDNPLTYTLKGLLGGYYAYLMTEPFYINIGVYNNAESRDLWEYNLELTKFEKEILVAHLWELSSLVAFDYYFFDENCSTYLINLLAIIRPNIEFKTIDHLFVVPIETLQEVVFKFKLNQGYQRHSLLNKISHSYKNLNTSQQILALKGAKDSKVLQKIDDIAILDTLNLYWKHLNYKEKTNLSSNEKKLMFATLSKRAGIDQNSSPLELKQLYDQAPDRGHKKSLIEFKAFEDAQKLRLRYGFHDFFDDSIGFYPGAYISFLDLTYYHSEERKQIADINWIKILSLQDYSQFNKGVSWQVDIKTQNTPNETVHIAKAGIGVAGFTDHFKLYYMPLLQASQSSELKNSFVNHQFGLRWNANSNFWSNINLEFNNPNKERVDQIFKMTYKKGEVYLNLEYTYNIQDKLSLGLMRYF